jgi:hypothetical protein
VFNVQHASLSRCCRCYAAVAVAFRLLLITQMTASTQAQPTPLALTPTGWEMSLHLCCWLLSQCEDIQQGTTHNQPAGNKGQNTMVANGEVSHLTQVAVCVACALCAVCSTGAQTDCLY